MRGKWYEIVVYSITNVKRDGLVMEFFTLNPFDLQQKLGIFL